MGCFTDLSLAEARAVGAEFGVDVHRVEALSEGSVNSNFRLTDAAGNRYFGRIYEEQGADGALAELRLLAELSRASVPTTLPLSARGAY
ncbi:MAG TPA: homoserine kinase, partial [Polyangiaceae bacterium]|nr:homoserine kinase [Polyangiaceae bacterium]